MKYFKILFFSKNGKLIIKSKLFYPKILRIVFVLWVSEPSRRNIHYAFAHLVIQFHRQIEVHFIYFQLILFSNALESPLNRESVMGNVAIFH